METASQKPADQEGELSHEGVTSLVSFESSHEREKKETLFYDEEIIKLASYQGRNEQLPRNPRRHPVRKNKLCLVDEARATDFGFDETLFNEHAMKTMCKHRGEKLR